MGLLRGMGMIRKHEVRTLVAICMALLVVLAAAIFRGSSDPTSSSTPSGHGAVAMEGVDVVITGQAERISTGYAVPINVTNNRDEPISVKDMSVIVTLTDIRKLNATCHGPDSVAPGQTEKYLVVIDELRDVDIFVIDLVKGDQYLRAVMPIISPLLTLPDVPSIVPDNDTPSTGQDDSLNAGHGSNGPSKDEPVVIASLNEELPLRPAYYDGNPPFFGVPVTGQVLAHVSKAGDATYIGVYVYLPDLTMDQVSIGASYAGGPRVPVQLVGDGASGCYGLLVDDPSSTGTNWTWHYGGSYHNITLTVTTYELGTHELRLYALDAETGERISEVEVTSYTVYGSGGQSSHLRMFDTQMSSDVADPFVPGMVYNITFKDTCRYDEYHGTVRSVFKCPYAVNVWLVDDNGSETLLTPNSLGEYMITWTLEGKSHDLQVRVQLGEEGGSYPLSSGQYWLEDASTGVVLSLVGDDGVTGKTFSVRGPAS